MKMIWARIQRVVARVTLALGIGLLLLGVLLTIDSGELINDLSTINQLFDGIFGGLVLACIMLVGIGVGLVKTRKTKSSAPPEPLVTSVPTGEKEDEQVFPGQQFNRNYRTVLASGDFDARESVRDRLRDAAIETVSAVEQQPRQKARELVLSGDWTDDLIVSAFLGDETAAEFPFKWKIYSWLYDDRAFKKSVERSLTQIEQYEQGATQ